MCIQSINRRYVARDWFCGLKEGPFLTKYSGTVMVSDVDTMVLLMYAVVTVFMCFGIYMVSQVIPRYTMILSLKNKLLMYQKHGYTLYICVSVCKDFWIGVFGTHSLSQLEAAAGPVGGPDPRAVRVCVFTSPHGELVNSWTSGWVNPENAPSSVQSLSVRSLGVNEATLTPISPWSSVRAFRDVFSL